jgi:hypothetical protein
MALYLASCASIFCRKERKGHSGGRQMKKSGIVERIRAPSAVVFASSFEYD